MTGGAQKSIRDRIRELRRVPARELLANPKNWRTHPKAQREAMRAVLAEIGFAGALLARETDAGELMLIDGHLRTETAPDEVLPVLVLDVTEAEADKILLTFDPLSSLATIDHTNLEALRGSVVFDNAELEAWMRPFGGANPNMTLDQARQTLAARFLVPPFSVLDARQGYWQDRKRAWIALGIQSELGRGGATPSSITADAAEFQRKHAAPGGTGFPNMAPPCRECGKERGDIVHADGAPGGHAFIGDTRRKADAYGRSVPADKAAPGGSAFPAASRQSCRECGKGAGDIVHKPGAPGGHAFARNTALRGDGHGMPMGAAANASFLDCADGTDPVSRQIMSVGSASSIFDPVLCELAYRWFCRPGGLVLDPFAGGSVRGIVAAKTGRAYMGIELRAEQIIANERQAGAICADNKLPLRWIRGDAGMVEVLAPDDYDFIFSCPPYGDLEVYSDDPSDLSRMAFDDFIAAYRAIIAKCAAMLRPDRFACFVVGDYRDATAAGYYRNFPALTIQAFIDAGLRLYNEAVLVTVPGSLPIRSAQAFEASRKLGKTHQNVLVFAKGDPKVATALVGAVEYGDLAPQGGDDASAADN